MNPVERALAALRLAADGLVDPGPIDAALRILGEPVRVALVGRRGAGKSSLAAWWTGTPQPVGLGGVTAAAVELSVPTGPPTTLVDTPGFDGPDDAVIRVLPALERAELITWVTDGLQPWTSTERAVHARLRAPDLPVIRVISRADLVEPTDRADVLRRLAALDPMPTGWADLRRGSREGGPLPPVLAFERPPPRRRARVREALGPLHAPSVPDARAVRSWFREAARDALAGVVARWESGELRGGAAVREALAGAHEGVLAELRPRVPVSFPPLPSPVGPDRVDRRALRAAGADWVSGVELSLEEGWGEVTTDHALRIRALGRALDLVRAAL